MTKTLSLWALRPHNPPYHHQSTLRANQLVSTINPVHAEGVLHENNPLSRAHWPAPTTTDEEPRSPNFQPQSGYRQPPSRQLNFGTDYEDRSFDDQKPPVSRIIIDYIVRVANEPASPWSAPVSSPPSDFADRCIVVQPYAVAQEDHTTRTQPVHFSVSSFSRTPIDRLSCGSLQETAALN